jgi:hypothetical protein
MQWTPAPGGGFSEPDVEAWLPYGDAAAHNVSEQRHDPTSDLSLTRDLIGLRDAIPELRNGDYRSLPTDNAGVWAWQRGERVVVVCNLSDTDAVIDGVHGTIRIATDRGRDDEVLDGTLHLAPWQAVIVFASANAV